MLCENLESTITWTLGISKMLYLVSQIHIYLYIVSTWTVSIFRCLARFINFKGLSRETGSKEKRQNKKFSPTAKECLKEILLVSDRSEKKH